MRGIRVHLIICLLIMLAVPWLSLAQDIPKSPANDTANTTADASAPAPSESSQMMN